MLPIPPNDPVVSYVPLPRVNYSGVEHRETLLPPDLSLAWQIHRLWAKKKRQMATSAACVLRDPVARLEAELVRRCMRLHRCDRQAELKVLGEQLAAICALPSRDFVLRLPTEHWHVLPQSWYVWNERGEVQCPCVLAREPIRKAAGLLRTDAGSGGGDRRHDLLRHGRLWMQPSAAFDADARAAARRARRAAARRARCTRATAPRRARRCQIMSRVFHSSSNEHWGNDERARTLLVHGDLLCSPSRPRAFIALMVTEDFRMKKSPSSLPLRLRCSPGAT